MRSRSRTDGNHRAIAAALRRLGWSVMDTAGVGSGFPDLVCCRGGLVRLVEVKTRTGVATDAQIELMGYGWPIVVVRTVDEAIALR